MATCLITGSSTGIGEATALTLARAGHTVFATMRNPAASPELPSIAADETLALHVLQLDVTSDESVRQCFERVHTEAGTIDVLVNNAGIAPIGAVEELDIDIYRQAMETNFFGSLRCIKAVLPSMRQAGAGWIVNVSSVGGRVAVAPQSAYNASKFALEALSEVLAQEMKAFGVRVAIVEPGVIQTPIYEKSSAPESSLYPHERRYRALIKASMHRAAPASLVAEAIKTIVEGNGEKLRYPVGSDARPYMAWRRMLADEEWIERNAEPSDDAWIERILSESGVDMRPFLES